MIFSVPMNVLISFWTNVSKGLHYKTVSWYCGYGDKCHRQYLKDAEIYLAIIFQASYVFPSSNLHCHYDLKPGYQIVYLLRSSYRSILTGTMSELLSY